MQISPSSTYASAAAVEPYTPSSSITLALSTFVSGPTQSQISTSSLTQGAQLGSAAGLDDWVSLTSSSPAEVVASASDPTDFGITMTPHAPVTANSFLSDTGDGGITMTPRAPVTASSFLNDETGPVVDYTPVAIDLGLVHGRLE